MLFVSRVYVLVHTFEVAAAQQLLRGGGGEGGGGFQHFVAVVSFWILVLSCESNSRYTYICSPTSSQMTPGDVLCSDPGVQTWRRDVAL